MSASPEPPLTLQILQLWQDKRISLVVVGIAAGVIVKYGVLRENSVHNALPRE